VREGKKMAVEEFKFNNEDYTIELYSNGRIKILGGNISLKNKNQRPFIVRVLEKIIQCDDKNSFSPEIIDFITRYQKDKKLTDNYGWRNTYGLGKILFKYLESSKMRRKLSGFLTN
jgi:hypothetical protein